MGLHHFIWVEFRRGCKCFLYNNLEIVEHWADGDDIRFDKELETVPGDNRIVVLIHPFYIMKPSRLVKAI